MTQATLTPQRVRELFSYDHATGVLIRLVRRSHHQAVGAIAGSFDGYGYRRVIIDNQKYLVHRVIWLWMTGEWPIASIDHANGNGLDNRWSNLRLATPSQQRANARRNLTNRSGYKGVKWMPSKRKWTATIVVNSRQKHLGYFRSPEDAHAAYYTAAQELFGAFARAK